MPAPHSKRRRLATPAFSTEKRHRSAPHSPEAAVPRRSARRSAAAATFKSATQSFEGKVGDSQRKRQNFSVDSAHRTLVEEEDTEKPAGEQTEVKSRTSSQSSKKRPQKTAIMTGSTWDYDDDGECGPQKWPMAVDGTRQSPIDLRLSKMNVITLQEPLQFVNYDQPLGGKFLNTGYSVQFLPNSQNSVPEIYGGLLDQHYRFLQYHYHWAQEDVEGSEHAICGLRYPAELHLVHQGVDDPNKLAVLGIFLHRGETDGQALKPDAEVFAELTECGQQVTAKSTVNLAAKLPDCQTSFVRYEGSLTTPPCSENVTWTIFTDPIEITPKQLELMRAIKDHSGSRIRKNCRPLQRLNNRTVFFARS